MIGWLLPKAVTVQGTHWSHILFVLRDLCIHSVILRPPATRTVGAFPYNSFLDSQRATVDRISTVKGQSVMDCPVPSQVYWLALRCEFHIHVNFTYCGCQMLGFPTECHQRSDVPDVPVHSQCCITSKEDTLLNYT